MLPASQAAFFNNLMQYLWGDDFAPEHHFAVRATGDRLKGTKGINPENAFDVLGKLTDIDHLKWYIRQSENQGEEHVAIAHIKFEDKSEVIVVAPHGIGSAIEIVEG